jgi:DNA-binding transcriptional MerR regulator
VDEELDEFGGDGPVSTWSVEELAVATGLSGHTLHDYDERGLATPSLRAHGGDRRYTVADVQRLVTVLAGSGLATDRVDGLLAQVEHGHGNEPE